MEVYIDGLGLRGPGLAGWGESRPALAGIVPYARDVPVAPASDLLPPNERRRMVPTVKFAIAAATEAIEQSGLSPDAVATVFASSSGDGGTIHAIFEALASPEREVSPTRFHNSVHNAAAGYWSIATGCREPSTSICCYNSSFAAGLLDAAAQAVVDRRSVMVIAYELAYPPPLDAAHPIDSSFSAAFVLAPAVTANSIARIRIGLERNLPVTELRDPHLEALRAGNGAARCLPMLCALAQKSAKTMVLDYVAGNKLVCEITPQ